MVSSLGFPPIYLKLQGAGENLHPQILTSKDKKVKDYSLLIKRPGKEQPNRVDHLFDIPASFQPNSQYTRKNNDQYVVTEL